MRENPELTVVGEASDADALLSQALALQPDLILLEWGLSDRPAGQLLAALRALNPSARVIVLSWRPGSEQDALAAGADRFVSKADGPEELVSALGCFVEKRDHQTV
jgi:DNA-binding NarL/FixJ family response regulator